jgi:hypothetical protein
MKGLPIIASVFLVLLSAAHNWSAAYQSSVFGFAVEVVASVTSAASDFAVHEIVFGDNHFSAAFAFYVP